MPDEQREQEPILEIGSAEKGAGVASTLLILTIIVTVLFVGFLVFWRFHLVSVASDKESTLTALQDQLGSSSNKKIESKANSVSKSMQILTAASKSKYLFRAFIDQLDTKITNDTKLNSLSIDNQGKVSLDGQSASYRSVADLAVSLSSFDKLSNVTISNLSQSASADNKSKTVVSFSMTATINDWKVSKSSLLEDTSAETSENAIPTVGGL